LIERRPCRELRQELPDRLVDVGIVRNDEDIGSPQLENKPPVGSGFRCGYDAQVKLGEFGSLETALGMEPLNQS
jgi:hypothetical protein